MTSQRFDQNVFINCPFDSDYQPILRPMLFCVVFANKQPRLATERSDSGESRLDKICILISESKFSIHDLCRCQAARKGEVSRLNMPFELGIDYGLRRLGGGEMASKRFLVLDEKPFRLKQALSDINGWDPKPHENKPERAMTIVRNWLFQEASVDLPGGEILYGQYLLFEEWKYARSDHSRADVDAYEHFELIKAMQDWVNEQATSTQTST